MMILEDILNLGPVEIFELELVYCKTPEEHRQFGIIYREWARNYHRSLQTSHKNNKETYTKIMNILSQI
jgi:hypothetical protein